MALIFINASRPGTDDFVAASAESIGAALYEAAALVTEGWPVVRVRSEVDDLDLVMRPS